jgi:hypothetical protein
LSVAALGVAPTYFINAASYVLLIGLILLMHTRHQPAEGTPRNPARASPKAWAMCAAQR